MSFHQYILRVMSGAERGPRATLLRGALAAAELFYAAAVRARNRSYDRRPGRARVLPRPVVSIGNLTAGGTGKTPVVRWLAGRLRDEGRRVAVLSRGYKAAAGTPGDEQVMLDRLLNAPGRSPVLLRADADRAEAAAAALREWPDLEVFLLDDGFQHRRVARNLDVVLVNATDPFGFGHVLPRGLLREPPAGLRRAGAVVLTHALGVDEPARLEIERELRRWNPHAPLYRCVHAPAALRTDEGVGGAVGSSLTASLTGSGSEMSLDAIRGRAVFAFSGLGNPAGFERDVRSLAGALTGRRRFADHHQYTAADLAAVRRAAREAGADVLVTTEKDWVKLAPLAAATAGGDGPPVWRLDVAARFLGDDEAALLAQVRGVIAEGTGRAVPM